MINESERNNIIMQISKMKDDNNNNKERLCKLEQIISEHQVQLALTSSHIQMQTKLFENISTSLIDVRDRLARLEGERTGQYYSLTKTGPINNDAIQKIEPDLQITFGKAAKIGSIFAGLSSIITYIVSKLINQ